MKTCRNIGLAHIAGLAGVVTLAGCGSSEPQRAAWRRAPQVTHVPATTTGSSAPATPVKATQPQMQVSLLSVELPRNSPTATAASTRTFEKRERAVFSLSADGTDDAAGETPVVTGVSRVTFAEEGADFDPSVSRDGGTLVFASTQHRKTADIYMKRTDSRVVTQLTNDPGQDAMPVISPDGTKIAFASDRAGNWDVYVMPVNGGRAVQVTSDLADDVHPSWSPDGRQLVYSRHGATSGRWEMWVTEVANPAVSNFIGYGVLPQWCPVPGTGTNGADRVLYQLGRERGRRTFSLWTLDLSGGTVGNTTEIASSASTALIDPSWSPDGRWVVYTEVPVSASGREEERPAWATLWMISGEGEAKVRLTGGSELTLSPVWASNNKLFFVSDRSGVDNIWSLDLNPSVRSAQATLSDGVVDGPVANSSSAVVNPAQPVMHNPVVSVPEPGEGTDH